jgi:hypothetical protein
VGIEPTHGQVGSLVPHSLASPAQRVDWGECPWEVRHLRLNRAEFMARFSFMWRDFVFSLRDIWLRATKKGGRCQIAAA